MKINRNKKSHKKLLITLSVIGLVLISGASVYAYSRIANNTDQSAKNGTSTSDGQKKINDVNYDSPTQDQIDNGNSIKQQTVENADNNTTTPTSSLDVTINSFKKDATNYHIEVDIAQIVSTGTCTITLTNSANQTLTYTADIQALPTYATCKGFDIPLSQLGSTQWTINASVTSGNASGTATGKTSL